MNTLELAVLALLILLLLLNGSAAIPIFAFILDPNRMRYSFDDPLAGQELTSKSPALQEWIIKLQALGFVLMGVKAEKLPLWGAAYREADFVSLEGETYASIVLLRNGKPGSLYFFTPFRDGGMIFTRNYSPGPQMESERISVRNVPSEDFNVILNDHLARLKIFKEKGLMPIAGQSPEARIEATRAFYASEYGRRYAKHMLSSSVMGVGIPLLLLLYVAIRYALVAR